MAADASPIPRARDVTRAPPLADLPSPRSCSPPLLSALLPLCSPVAKSQSSPSPFAPSLRQAAKMEKLHAHLAWLQSFCTKLVEKSLLKRNEPKPEREPKRRRRAPKKEKPPKEEDAEDAAAAEGGEDGEATKEKRKRRRKPKAGEDEGQEGGKPARPAKGPGSRGGTGRRSKRAKKEAEEEQQQADREDEEDEGEEYYYERYEGGWSLQGGVEDDEEVEEVEEDGEDVDGDEGGDGEENAVVVGVRRRRQRGPLRAGRPTSSSGGENVELANSLSVAELLGLVGASRGLHGMSSGAGPSPRGTHDPLAELPAHLASHLASPLAIYDSDFAPHSGCLSSPHHFLSPRTVEQLNAEGGLTSAELQVAESGEEAAAACLSGRLALGGGNGTHTRSLPNLHGPSLLSAGSRRKLPPVSAPPSYRQGGHPVFKGAAAAAAAVAAAAAAASAAASPRPSSASSKGEGKLLPPGVASASSSLSSGARSAADLAASVYEAIGGLATLAAAAPPAAQSRRGEKRARLDPYRATSTGEVDEGYEGAGISERRKPAGLGNLRLPTTNSCAPPAGTVTVRPLPHSAGAQPSSSSSDHSSGQHSHLSLASSSALGTSADPTPASARSVTDIAALVSPAIAGLGGYSALGLQSGLHSGRLHAQPGAGGGGGGGSSSLAPSPGKIAAMSPKGFGASAVSPGKQQHIGSGGTVSSPNTGAPPRIVDLVAC